MKYEGDIFSDKSSPNSNCIRECERVTFDQFDRLSCTIHNTTIRIFASQRHYRMNESKTGFSIIFDPVLQSRYFLFIVVVDIFSILVRKGKT